MRLAILLVTCVVLTGLSAYLGSKHRETQKTLAAEQIMKLRMSEKLDLLQERVSEEEAHESHLTRVLQARNEVLVLTSNELRQAQEALEQTQVELSQTRQQLQSSQSQVEALSGEIADLEAQRGDLSKELGSLSSALQSLNRQIEQTESELVEAKGDREFLLAELQRLRAEKEEMERQFNDWQALKSQLAKLRRETVINRRLAWMKRGVYDRHHRKGAELLLVKESPMFSKSDPGLQVEFHEEEGARVISPGKETPPER